MNGGRRTSKFSRLVDDFLTTCQQRRVQVSRAVIEQHLSDAVDGVAQRMGVTTQTALRSYFDDHWGEQAGHLFCDQHDTQQATLAGTPDAVLPVGFLGRLVAGLGQAHFFAALNTDPHLTSLAARTRARDAHPPAPPPPAVATPAPTDAPTPEAEEAAEALLREIARERRPRFDARTAAEASTGLGLALAAAPTGTDFEVAEVPVDGSVLAKTRAILTDLVDRLAPGAGRWRACLCPGPCDEADTTTQIRAAMTEDLELLDLALAPRAAAGEDGGQVLRFPPHRKDTPS